MSILLGIEVAGAAVRLVVIDRQAQVLVRREEPLLTPATRWWETHPDERHRAVIGLLAEAVADGMFRPAQVAAIGITADPALALLDADLDPIPPRDLPWGKLDPTRFEGDPWGALGALFEETPRAMVRIGSILDLVGFLRYRLSGSLATQVDFAWQGGHIVSPENAASWNAGSLDNLGILPSHVPPIFPTTQRVSVVGEKTIEKTGLRRGTWIVGGGDPLNTRLLFAGEPKVGRIVAEASDESVVLYESIEPPTEWAADIVPTAIEGIFFRRVDEIEISAVQGGGLPEGAILDWPAGVEIDDEALPESQRIAIDAGEASAGTAIIAGLGLGWWRDPRPIWRKRRPARPLSEWREARAAAEASPDEDAEAADV